MLDQLQVSNLALSSKAEVDFAQGFCCITGETGAGKSLLIDALSLILGARSDPSLIKSGEDKAEVSAWFSISSKERELRDFIAREDLAGDDDNSLLIRRVISLEGKSRAYVNGHSCTQATLKALGKFLVAIHGQHASVKLIDPDEQLHLLDSFAGIEDKLEKVREAFSEYSKARLSLTALAQEQKAGASIYKTLRYELEALRSLDLSEGSYEHLEQAYDKAVHEEEVSLALASMLNLLSTSEHNLLEELESKTQALEKILPFAKELSPIVESLINSTNLLAECRDALESVSLNLGQSSAQDLSEKMSRYHELARRFAVSPQDLYTKTLELEEKIGRFLSLKDEIAKLSLEVKSLKEAYEVAEQDLHEARVAAAMVMSEKVSSLIHDLAMSDGRFEVRVRFDESARPRKLGRDEVSFYFSANLGEDLRTLGQAASGGELSRLALAIETINSKNNATPTMVFDEVDAGISGRTASSVGDLLHKIASSSQVLCVTHLPQVAAKADRHFLVSKHNLEGRVTSEVKVLDQEGRINELARMMGGNLVSNTTLESAKELLERSKDGT